MTRHTAYIIYPAGHRAGCDCADCVACLREEYSRCERAYCPDTRCGDRVVIRRP